MSRGYLIMAQGDYVRQAQALALSIAKTQSRVKSVSVITDHDLKDQIFDHVIKFDQKDLSGDQKWKIHNRSYFYDLTPYDETVILDADMLFLSDVSHWWDYMQKYELLITDKVKNFRGDWITTSPYRKTFESNQLPNLYSAFSYFKKTELSRNFFELIKLQMQDWKTWSQRYANRDIQNFPSIDVAMAIAAKILGCETAVSSLLDYPTFTHMKPGCQGWSLPANKCSEVLNIFVSDHGLRFGPYLQTGVLHYVEKDFVNKDVLRLFK